MKKIVLLFTVLFGHFVISGCATQPDSSSLPNYRVARAQTNLELPPDLINTSSEALKRRSEKESADSVLPIIEGVEIKRNDKGERWLVVSADANNTWATLVDFTLSTGLPISIQSKQKAIIETDWIGDDNVTSGVNKVLRFFGSGRSSVNDKFMFWLERITDKETALFVGHRQLKQVAKNLPVRDEIIETAWVEEAGDEFKILSLLRNLKEFYGGDKEVDVTDDVVLVSATDNPHIVLRDNLESANDRLRRGLVSADYELLSENTKKNLFVVREHRKKGGILSKLTVRKKHGIKAEPFGANGKIKITVTTSKGATVPSKDSLSVLYRIAGELRK